MPSSTFGEMVGGKAASSAAGGGWEAFLGLRECSYSSCGQETQKWLRCGPCLKGAPIRWGRQLLEWQQGPAKSATEARRVQGAAGAQGQEPQSSLRARSGRRCQ